MSATPAKFEAALSIAHALDSNQRATRYYKQRLLGLAEAAGTIGLGELEKALSGLAEDIAAQGKRLSETHKATHKILVGT